MKVSPVLNNSKKSILEQMRKHKWDAITSMVAGECKQAKLAQQKYAKLAVDNFELVPHSGTPLKGSIPIFSKIGLNILKYLIYRLFTKKTPEEKKLNIMAKLYKAGKLDIYQ